MLKSAKCRLFSVIGNYKIVTNTKLIIAITVRRKCQRRQTQETNPRKETIASVVWGVSEVKLVVGTTRSRRQCRRRYRTWVLADHKRALKRTANVTVFCSDVQDYHKIARPGLWVAILFCTQGARMFQNRSRWILRFPYRALRQALWKTNTCTCTFIRSLLTTRTCFGRLLWPSSGCTILRSTIQSCVNLQKTKTTGDFYDLRT